MNMLFLERSVNNLFLYRAKKAVSYVLMELLLLWTYISYYARGWKAMNGFIRAFMRNTPILRMLYGKTV